VKLNPDVVLKKLINIDNVIVFCHSINSATKLIYKCCIFTLNQNEGCGCDVVMKRKEDWKK